MTYPPRSLVNIGIIFIQFLAVSFVTTSCVGTRPAVPYFSNGLIDTVKVQAVTVPEQRIQKGDVLSISIFSDNPSATAIYNQAGGSGSAAPAGTSGERGMPASSPDGYLVDNNGYIRLHAIGLLKVEGITRQNLETLIIEKINQLGVLSNPYCVVRYSNFKITVLGEVRTPGVFTIPTEKVNVLEALGMAGDITDFGLKDQILLIRENGTSRTYANINLTDPAIFNSLNFYLQQNDVIVVKPDKKKPTSSDSLRLQYISLGLAAVSTIALIITLFR